MLRSTLKTVTVVISETHSSDVVVSRGYYLPGWALRDVSAPGYGHSHEDTADAAMPISVLLFARIDGFALNYPTPFLQLHKK
ncbi:hypothetical protein SAMN05444714_2000 [Yoonia litorea]|uniref:Uncharacterized protein n=1 Tax=Yoonia litorea TaxID=1123755 RepID=A0A1I6MLH5_9RHOB|nr:hypothetical protein SAMN05444714_2000 [Yoonia litorea]